MEIINVSVPPDLKEWVRRKASEDRRSQSSFVAKVLDAERAREERRQSAGSQPSAYLEEISTVR